MSVIVASVATAIIGFLIGSLKLITRNRDRAFALEKCNQMLEEITAYSLAGEDVIEIDRFKDLTPKPVLTADTNITNPSHVLSGNTVDTDGGWKFLRTIDILPIHGEPRARLVSVKVYYSSEDSPSEAGLLLAQLTKLLKTAGDVFPPTQVYDVYAIAIENTPGWWVDMSVMKPMMQQAINSLRARNPGLEYRVHWITRNGFGRDPYYRPFFNRANDATDAGALPYCYIYPSAIFVDNDFFYYPPDEVAGNKNVDGVQFDDPIYPYTLADYYNHAVRYPEEVERYNAMVSAYETAGLAAPEPSLSMLFQDMYDNPGKYENALIFNLHGELIPLPPVRNYSDPAKDADDHPNLRVVAHPQKMFYNDDEDADIRVYAYWTDPANHDGCSVVDNICIFFPGLDIGSSYFDIKKMEGCDTILYSWRNAVAAIDYSISVTTVGGSYGTLIELYDTPSRTPWNNGPPSGGIMSQKRLYGYEYIPCATEAGNDFSRDLATNGNVVKNTARWVITIDETGLPDTAMVTFVTFIGPSSNYANPPTNRSETYFWRSIAPPIIEQLQLLGDPRLMPYADIKANAGYNWFFNDRGIGSDYHGFNKHYANLWKGETQRIDVDIPKAFMLIRHAITRADAIWNAMTGYSYYYYGMGQEIGGDAANHPEYDRGIPMETTPWVNDVSPSNKIDEITSSYERTRIPGARDGSWTVFPWLGELYPESYWATWKTQGNLDDNTFARIKYSDAEWGGDFTSDQDRIKRTQGPGCISFFNAVPQGTAHHMRRTFTHYYYGYSSEANITSDGESLAVRFKLPLTSKMRAARPFVLNSNSPPHGFPVEWNDNYYEFYRYETQLSNIYYTYSSDKASAIVNLYPPAGEPNLTGHVAHILVNGLSPSKDQGASWIVMYGLASMTQGFMDEGHPGKPSSSRIHQLPRIEITDPEPNSSVEFDFSLDWSADWVRWDGLKYGYSYPADFYESDYLQFAIKYSPDGGRHWYYESDDTPTVTGERPDGSHIITSGPVNINLATEGAYIIRVEAFRRDILSHYSYHQIRVLVNVST